MSGTGSSTATPSAASTASALQFIASADTIAQAALLRASCQSTIVTLYDGSLEANVCLAFLPNVFTQAMTAYPWRWCRRIATLVPTLPPLAYGVPVPLGPSTTSTNPEWQNEFYLPTDCLKVREIIDPNMQSANYDRFHDQFQQGMPFDQGIGLGPGGQAAGPVIWANLPVAIPNAPPPAHAAIYTSNVLDPMLWPPAFQQLVTWLLAAEIVIPITGNGQVAAQMREGAQDALMKAIEADSPRSFQSTDYTPDWMAVRGFSDPCDWEPVQQMATTFPSGFQVGGGNTDQAAVPAYLQAAGGVNGVPIIGVPASEIGAAGHPEFIPAFTPGGQIGVFRIGSSPIGWRPPFHGQIDIAGGVGIGIEAIGVDAIDGGSTPVEEPEGYEA